MSANRTLRDLLAVTVREIRNDFNLGRRKRARHAQVIRAEAALAIDALIEQLDIEHRDETMRCEKHAAPFLAGKCIGCHWNLPGAKAEKGLVGDALGTQEQLS